MFGDPKQLPPVVKSDEGKQSKLAKGFIEMLHESKNSDAFTCMLTEQFRFNSVIGNWSNYEFYQNRLTAHPGNAKRYIPGLNPVHFVETYSWDVRYVESQNGFNRDNCGEASTLIDYLIQMKLKGPMSSIPNSEIGIIATYKAQVHLLKSLLAKRGFNKVTVSTVDSFQGQERRIILISLVRLWFLPKLS